ncbi:MAG: PAS domain S-box protein [Heyndrickxia sp.]
MRKSKFLLLYFIASFIWIFLTEYLMKFIGLNLSIVLFVERIKGILYIMLTGGFIYFALNKKEEYDLIRQEERKLSTLINSMVDYVIFKDGEGRWIQANQFCLKLFQLEHIHYKGKTNIELAEFSPSYKKTLLHNMTIDELTWKKGIHFRNEEKIPLPNGESKTFETIKVPLFNPDGSRKALVVIGRDITERLTAEQKLNENQQQYRSLIEYNPDLVYMVNLDGIITQLNPAFEIISGYRREEFVGKPIFNLFIEDSREKFIEQFKIIVNGGNPTVSEVNITSKDGKKLTLNCTTVPMKINDQLVGVIGYGRDITKMKETEEHLRKTEKLSVVGELAASVAHEVRNPLTSIKGFIQLMETEDQKNKRYYDIILKELDRINEIVSELLVLAKPQDVIFKKCDVFQILEDVTTLLKSESNMRSVELVLQIDDTIPKISCDANQLKMVFINIIKNAIEASNQREQVHIFVSNHQGHSVLIQVKDNGIGISAERLKRIGEPFFSHKEKGTGLGLTICFRIIEAHNGKILFESELGEGTTVDIILPVER